MTTLLKAAQQALEALDGLSEDAVCQSSHHAKKDQHTSLDVCPVFLRLRAAITALKAALEEPVQEPVAWMVYTLDGKSVCVTDNPTDFGSKHKALPLYTAPPQRKPLTDEEIEQEYKKGYADGYAAGYDNGDSEGFTRGTDSMVPASLAAWRAETKPLTEAQIYAAIKGIDSLKAVEVARAVERAHGIKESP